MTNNNSEYILATVYDWKDKNENYEKPVYIIKETRCFYYVVYVKNEVISPPDDYGAVEHQWLFYEPIDTKKAFRIKKENTIAGYKEGEKGRNIFYIKTT